MLFKKKNEEEKSEIKPFSFKLKLSSELRTKLADEIIDEIDLIKRERQENYNHFGNLEAQWRKADEIWDSYVAPTAFPFPKASNLPGFIIPMVVDGGRSSIMKAFYFNPPWVLENAKNGEKKAKIENFLQDLARSKIENFEDEISSWVNSAFLKGTGICRLDIKKNKEKYLEINTYKGRDDLKKFNENHPEKNKENENYRTRLRKGEKITLFENKISETEYNAIEYIPLENTLIHTSAKDLNKENIVGEKNKYTWEELKDKEAQGEFENIDQLIDYDENGQPHRETEYEVAHVVYKRDIDGDGIKERCIFALETSKKIFLKAIRYPLTHNRIKYIPAFIYPRTKGFFRMGFYQKLWGLHTEHKRIHDLIVNSGYITFIPTFKALKNSDFDPYGNPWYPGKVFWLDNMDEVVQFDVRPSQMNFERYEQLGVVYARDLSGISPYRSGMPASNRDESGKKVELLLMAGAPRLDEFFKHIKPGFNEIGRQLAQNCYQLIENEISYTGGKIKKSDLEVGDDEEYLSTLSAENVHPDEILQRNMLVMDRLGKTDIVRKNPLAEAELVKQFLISARHGWQNRWNIFVPDEKEMKRILGEYKNKQGVQIAPRGSQFRSEMPPSGATPASPFEIE